MGQGLAGHLGVLGEERHPQAAMDAVAGGHGVEHERVQEEGLLLAGDAVVGEHEPALAAVSVEVPDVVLGGGELVDRRLHRFLQIVELPGGHLADVAVPVDDVAGHPLIAHAGPLPCCETS